MDPMQILLAALSVGGSLLKPVAEQAAKDAYAGLKTLVIRKFGEDEPKLESTIDDYADDPETYEKPMAKLLSKVGAERDQTIVDQATVVLQAAESAQPGVTGGLVGQINAQGGKVIVAQTIHGGITM